jgi:hypothetical protein
MVRTASSVSAAHFHLLDDDFLRDDSFFRKEYLFNFRSGAELYRLSSHSIYREGVAAILGCDCGL